jgi:hypothetical protein
MPAKVELREYAREINWPYAILFGVLANVPMWIAGSIHRLEVVGWFNLDFLVVGVIALFLPRAISAGLLLTAMVVDFLAEITVTYYMAPADILSNAPEVVSIPGLITPLCVGAVLVLAVASTAFFLPRRNRQRFPTAILLVLFALVCRGAKQLELDWDARSGFWVRFSAAPHTTHAAAPRYLPTRSSTRQLMFGPSDTFKDDVEWTINDEQASTPMESAAAVAYRRLSANSQDQRSLPDFVLILVESWGVSADQEIRQSLFQPYESELGGRYEILRGSVPFRGPTVSGENRELCGRSGGQSVMAGSVASFRNCLPEELRGLGFHTIAVHGYHGGFYHRKYWYPRVGFEEIWFALQLESTGLPDCVGIFNGVCDAAVANWIGKRLRQPDPGPRFVYWVTLNSHLPVPEPADLPTLVPCDTEASLARDPALCNWYRLILNVHQSIASLASHDGSRPVVYVIVGDHAPPFSDPNLRAGFDQNSVPYVILLPYGEAAEPLFLSRHAGIQPTK